MVYRVEGEAANAADGRQGDAAAYAGGAELARAAVWNSRAAVAPELAFLHSAPPAALKRAGAEACWLGVTADRALLAGRAMDEDDFYRALAGRLGAPFVATGARLNDDFDYAAAARAGVAPLARGGARRWLVAPRGKAIAALGALPDASGLAITTPRRFDAFVRAAHARRIAEDAAHSVARLEPRLSAATGPRAIARVAAAGLLAAAIMLAALFPVQAWFVAGLALLAAFSAATVLRLLVAAASLAPERAGPPLADRDLPVYTVVVALYREAEVAGALVRALERLDYPRAKLDIKFVVEHDDAETARALAVAIPGVEYEIVVAPPGAPRTKPRALNVALPFARGDLLAVFDAEDAPAPDQLRRAAALFAVSGPDVACLQARLVIDNWSDNWLAGMFAIDYAGLFDCINPGLAALRLPIALGGTSNHFRIEVLRGLGGWDAWNVTEDADLGLRLARCGFRVATFASRTCEEAPRALGAFLRQRVRWLKGWMQTAYVHARDPRALWRNVGPRAFCALAATFVANVASPLVWPFFTALLMADLASGALLAPQGLGELLFSTLALWLALAGLAAMVWPALIGMWRQGLRKLWPHLLLAPVWHLLLAVAGWWALWELWRKPFFWAKTAHGQALRRLEHRF